MSAPPEATISNLSGIWVMNKTLSDSSDPLLALQGLSWFTRTAISLATITLSIKQYEDEDSKTHVDIDQTATGGIKGTTENRTLDFQDRMHSDYLFGNVRGKSRFLKLEELEIKDPEEAQFLKGDGYGEGFLEGDSEGEEGKKHIQSAAVNIDETSTGGWEADQIWGFELIDGERYYTRRVVVRKDDESKKARLVYDYQGPVDS